MNGPSTGLSFFPPSFIGAVEGMVTFKAVNVEVVCLVLHKCLDFFLHIFG